MDRRIKEKGRFGLNWEILEQEWKGEYRLTMIQMLTRLGMVAVYVNIFHVHDWGLDHFKKKRLLNCCS